MRILITGITGFVGEYLAKEILKNNPNDKIFGIDRIKKTFQIFPELNKKVKIYECDITNKLAIAKIIKIIHPDLVYHLAGYSSTKVQDKSLVYRINVSGTINILEALKQIHKKIRIILISSAQVYGETKKPATENQRTNPVGIYAQSKLEMEKKVQKFKRDLEIIIIRPSNHTGPGQKAGFLVPDTVNKIINSKNIIIVRNPETKKDISDVRDVVRGYVIVMEKGIPGGIYNIGSGKLKSIKIITNMLIKISNRKIKCQYQTSEERLKVSSVNPLKIKKLGWKPKYQLAQTLRAIYRYYIIQRQN